MPTKSFVRRLLSASLPWIKLVDDALEPDNREKSGAESCQAGQKKNAEREQRLPPCRLCQSARQASFAPSSTRGTGSAVPVHRASGIVECFVLAVAGDVVLRHFCARCRQNFARASLLARSGVSLRSAREKTPVVCSHSLTPATAWEFYGCASVLIRHHCFWKQPIHPGTFTHAPHPDKGACLAAVNSLHD